MKTKLCLPNLIFLAPLLSSFLLHVACTQEELAEESEAPVLAGSPSDFLATVLLTDGSSKVMCSGTLIAPNVVLSAAHCAEAVKKVVVGRSTVLEPGNGFVSPTKQQTYDIVSSRIHPSYVPFGSCPTSYDVLMLKLDRPVLWAIPVPLGEAPIPGESCKVIGFGRHNVSGSTEEIESSAVTRIGERREARVKIDVVDTESAFGAKGTTGAHSQGDSGGTLVCGGRLKGIVSCTPNRDLPVLELRKMYATVASARPFIDETLRSWKTSWSPFDAGSPLVEAGVYDGGGVNGDAGF